MKTLFSAAALLPLAAAADCNGALEAACAHVPDNDISAALACLRGPGARALRDAACDPFPAEAEALFVQAVEDPAAFAAALAASPFAAKVQAETLQADLAASAASASFAILQDDERLPTVFAHGMGDSCFNSGMKQITADTGKHLGSYAVCVPTGDNVLSDTINGFLMTMDKSVDVFAAKIQADPKLAGGFNMVGFSQGNSLIRGYIHKYNGGATHNVKHVLHVHGTVSGVSGFPQCDPAGALGAICKGVSQLCGDLAFNSLVQGILFQADYFRDPRKVSDADYMAHSQLAAWNQEATAKNGTFKDNFVKVESLTMVKAEQDTMVFPNEGEWWGHFADGDTYKPIPMNQTKWYTEDMFGLKTLDAAGKIHFESTAGNHLQFTEAQLFGWVDKYFK